MSKTFKFISIFSLSIVLFECSFDNKTKIWTNKEKQEVANSELIKVSEDQKNFQEELNSESIIKFKSVPKKNNNWVMSGLNYSNLTGYLMFDGQNEKFSKFKFKKIQHNKIRENSLILEENYFITVDGKGTIFKFVNKEKLQWSVNIYNKREKKKIENISLALSKDKLYATDNLGKYYVLNLKNGKIIWVHQHNALFNSQIKVSKNKIFVVDSNNVIYCFSTLDGKEIWKFKTQPTFIKTDKKASVIVTSDSILFSNSAGDITRVNIDTGELIWLIPTQNTKVKHTTNFLETSDIVLFKNTLFFSNNFSKFYSLDLKTGILNWIQNINSNLRPIIIDNYLFTVTQEGYLVVIDSKKGEIIRSSYILNGFSSRQKNELSIQGFLVASKKVYITTNLGYLIICSANEGKVENVIKIDGSQLSEPVIGKNNLYILTNNSVVVFD